MARGPTGLTYAGVKQDQPLPPRRLDSSLKRKEQMTSNTMTERTVCSTKRHLPRRGRNRSAHSAVAWWGPGASGLSNYSRNVKPLAQQFRVIVPDMPGYGRSTKGVDGSDPFGYLADHIRGMLDELGIDRAHLVGNSYGGSCALRLALDTPHRVDRLVLMGPGGIGTTRDSPRPASRACSAITGVTGRAWTSYARSSARISSTTAMRCRSR